VFRLPGLHFMKPLHFGRKNFPKILVLKLLELFLDLFYLQRYVGGTSTDRRRFLFYAGSINLPIFKKYIKKFFRQIIKKNKIFTHSVLPLSTKVFFRKNGRNEFIKSTPEHEELRWRPQLICCCNPDSRVC
jgi:hypothetical protein